MTRYPFSKALYNLATGVYFSLLKGAAHFHPKARLMVKGRRETPIRLREGRHPGARFVWFHVSSLGEFEQGRPVIEALKKRHPEYKVCLTFFSPSGYEVRKDYPIADLVLYLPFDHSKDLRTFIDTLNPEIVVFVKYDFWLDTLEILRDKRIPTYLISAKFRPDQPFFKPWGGLFREALRGLKEIFVQDEDSLKLLAGIGITKVIVAGDTRADRVLHIAEHPLEVPEAEHFANNSLGLPILVVGSSWDRDEAHYIPYLKKNVGKLRAIIAPHEIHEGRIQSLLETLSPLNVHRLTYGLPPENTEVLVVDRIGLLSSIYSVADLVYIGGGFGNGIHNILEPAVYGLPVIFGPKYGKFPEAGVLLSRGGAFTYSTEGELIPILDRLVGDEAYRRACGDVSGAFIRESAGATALITKRIFD